MAVDDRTERGLSAGLHAWLDPVAGPHPRWDGSAAQLVLAMADAPARRRIRRSSWTTLLVAAALVLLALVAALWAGGRLEQRPSIPPPDQGLVTALTDPPPTPSPSGTPAPSAAPDTPSSVDNPSAVTCVSRWSHDGTVDPLGQMDGIRTVELNGYEGHVNVIFGHSIDTVRSIVVAPAAPPFVTESGKTVHVRGAAFYTLTMHGLTRRTWNSPADMVAGKDVPRFTRTVELPIAEMQRIRVPTERLPNDGPKADSTETWVIGLERPACLDVQVKSIPGYSDDATDNTIIIRFPPVTPPSG